MISIIIAVTPASNITSKTTIKISNLQILKIQKIINKNNHMLSQCKNKIKKIKLKFQNRIKIYYKISKRVKDNNFTVFNLSTSNHKILIKYKIIRLLLKKLMNLKIRVKVYNNKL